jgi:hypothetical protein
MTSAGQKNLIGWKEWCTFPDLNLPAVKAKIDTGARTSALHAYDMEPFVKDGKEFLKFKVHPLQISEDIERECIAPLIDRRAVISSNGHYETRYVIRTKINLGDKSFTSDITLTTRFNMRFRMLLGRSALIAGNFTVDPSIEYVQGKKTHTRKLYLKDK